MINQDYANEKESECYEKMRRFNEFLHLLNLGQAPPKHHFDASATTPTSRYVEIELKDRNQNLLKADKYFAISGCSKEGKSYTATTLYIENHKVADLLMDYVANDSIPLYINFLNDDVVIVFNLSQIKHRPQTVSKRIKSELYQSFEFGKRMELQLEDAYIYQLKNNEWKMLHSGNGKG